MGVFDETGAVNQPDSGGDGDNSVAPPPTSLPSVATPPIAPQPTPDPRLQAALAALQPKPQATGWHLALQKIVPLLGAAVAMSQNAGGSFTNAWQQGLDDQQKRADQEAERNLRLATILHQQETERQQAEATASRERIAQKKVDDAAAKEQRDKQTTEERQRFNDVLQGPVIEHANELAASQGKDAVDQYLSRFHGIGGDLKILADKYGLRDVNTGAIATGKTKSDKEITAGSKEEYILRARDMASKALGGRPLTDEEQQASDEKALTRYASLTKDDDQTKILRGLQIDAERLRIEGMQRQADRDLTEKYGSTPIWMQDGEGKPHVYFVKKGEKGQPPALFELPNPGLPPDVSRLQPPSAWDKFLRGFGFGKTSAPPVIKQIGGGADPSDPNWGK